MATNDTVILCEKPKMARNIAGVLGVTSKGHGYIETPEGTITWGIGHLVEQGMPEDYDPRYKKWNIADLPIEPDHWIAKPVAKTRDQYKIVIGLLKKAKKVVIATDAGREGEMIARELMELANFQGPVKRLWTSGMDDASIRKAWPKLLPGEEKAKLYDAALVRSRGDWLFGMNLSRAATKVLAPEGALFSYGRVQTPVLGMVVTRDLLIENFKPRDYFEIAATVQAETDRVVMRFAPPEDKRVWERALAEKAVERVRDARGPIEVKTERKHTAPPLPYSLPELQGDANHRFGFTAAKTLKVAQQLYDDGYLSYPRTGSRQLLDELKSEIAPILSNLKTCGLLRVDIREPLIRKKVFRATLPEGEDHPAITPTTKRAPFDKLDADQQAVYGLVADRYASQFMPDYEYDQTVMLMKANGIPLVARGNTPVIQGWKAQTQSGQGKADKKEKEPTLPAIKNGENGHVIDAMVETKTTKPPEHYTEKTLLKDMGNIQKYVEDPRYKQILKETSGIGTPATQASFIETIKKRGYVDTKTIKKRKYLVSTDLGRAFIKALPEAMWSPALSAVWEDYLDGVATGQRDPDSVLRALTDQMRKWLDILLRANRIEIEGFAPKGKPAPTPRPAGDAPPCPKCGGTTDWRQGKNGGFWGCTNYPECKGIANVADPSSPECPQCGGGMRKRTGARGPFWGCLTYPECKGIVNIEQGAGKPASGSTKGRRRSARKTATA